MFAPAISTNPPKHFDPLRKTRPFVLLVRQLAGHGEHNLIHVDARGFGERDMRTGYGVERSRNDADPLCAHRRFFNRNGSTYWITCLFASIAPAYRPSIRITAKARRGYHRRR